jgi:hypothetical protein
LVSGLSSTSTSSAASRLSGATNRALQGQWQKVSEATASRPVPTTVTHKTQTAGSKASTVRTTSGHSGSATASDQGAKLPSGIAHVWPENALTPAPEATQ